MIQRYDTRSTDLLELQQALRRPALHEVTVAPHVQAVSDRVFGQGATPTEAVRQIISAVRTEGDQAMLRYTAEIDAIKLPQDKIFVSEEEIEQAKKAVDPDIMEAIRLAAQRIRTFHKKQLQSSWFMAEPNGSVLGQRFVPLERVGCYVPGGRFPLVSTALMSVVPAAVAGVEEIIAATPTDKNGVINPHVIVALHEAGAHRILRVGGAQAVAALAYGTDTVPKVDKIVGPGNLFVQLAKNMVFGVVGIDSLAGPSEVLIVADETANPEWIAADLLSQAEHDTEAAAILITTDADIASAVIDALEKQLVDLPTADTARASLERWGRIVTCRDMDEAVHLANLVAPEHLELFVRHPETLLGRIRHAGAVFIGGWSTEPIGDYIAGPNHILPTNGAARFASPLSVEQFFRRSGMIQMSEQGLAEIGPSAVTLARLEGLEAHARAIEIRLHNIRSQEK